MSLSRLIAPRGASRERKRVGRGQASGLGKTAGRGGKGQKARTGNMHFEGFEGGQMPLQRRLPKFGFASRSRRELEEVQVTALAALPAGVVDAPALERAGLIRGNLDGVVVLGKGELANALTVKADRVTAGARQAIEKAGGKVELVPRPLTMGQKAKAEHAAQKAEKAAQKAGKTEQKAGKTEQKAGKTEQKAEQAEQKAEQKTQKAEQATQKAEQKTQKAKKE